MIEIIELFALTAFFIYVIPPWCYKVIIVVDQVAENVLIAFTLCTSDESCLKDYDSR